MKNSHVLQATIYAPHPLNDLTSFIIFFLRSGSKYCRGIMEVLRDFLFIVTLLFMVPPLAFINSEKVFNSSWQLNSCVKSILFTRAKYKAWNKQSSFWYSSEAHYLNSLILLKVRLQKY